MAKDDKVTDKNTLLLIALADRLGVDVTDGGFGGIWDVVVELKTNEEISPKKKTPISIEYVKALMEQRAFINRLDFRDMELYKNGKKLDIPEDVLAGFELTGLNNIDFIWSSLLQ